MNVSKEQFEVIKNFAIEANISTTITTLNEPIAPFDYSLLSKMYEGEYIKHSANIHPLFIKKIQEDRYITFTMEQYSKETNSFHSYGEDFYPNEGQLEIIQRDNFGALSAGYNCLKFLNKEQYQFNHSVKKAQNDYDQFISEWKRLSPMFEVYANFQKIKQQAQEYECGELIEKWDTPIFPPNKPENTKSRISTYGAISPFYMQNISKGSQVTYADIDQETGLLTVYGQNFKLSDEQVAELKSDNFALIFDQNGFPYISNKHQAQLMQQYVEENKYYLEFSKAYSDVKYKIMLEKYGDICKLQHDELAKLPFPYYVAIKVNMRLLTPNSRLTGERSNTVQHIVVEEAFSRGRLKRDAQEFLCGGDSHLGLTSREQDGGYNITRHGIMPYEVTCNRCLEIAKRIIKKEGA